MIVDKDLYAWNTYTGDWVPYDENLAYLVKYAVNEPISDDMKKQIEREFGRNFDIFQTRYEIPMIDRVLLFQSSTIGYSIIRYPRPDWSSYPNQDLLERIKQQYRITIYDRPDSNEVDEEIEKVKNSLPDLNIKLRRQGRNIEDYWYWTFRIGKGKDERPYSEAITILAEIFSWFAPNRKEYDGDPFGKFRLQTYEDFAGKFGMAVQDVKDAFDYLEDYGVIRLYHIDKHLANGNFIDSFLIYPDGDAMLRIYLSFRPVGQTNPVQLLTIQNELPPDNLVNYPRHFLRSVSKDYFEDHPLLIKSTAEDDC